MAVRGVSLHGAKLWALGSVIKRSPQLLRCFMGCKWFSSSRVGVQGEGAVGGVASASDAERLEVHLPFGAHDESSPRTSGRQRRVAAQDPNRRLQKPELPEKTFSSDWTFPADIARVRSEPT